MIRSLCLALCLAAACDQVAQAALPQTLNYQGRMRLTSGAAVADSPSHSASFALYSQLSGGTALWTETHSGSVATKDGLFNVVLGSINPITLPFDQKYWLGVNFNGNGEMAPRSELTMAPYAFRAAFADNVAVGAPLSLTSPSAASAIHAANLSGGAGVHGTVAFASGAIAGLAGEANGNGSAMGVFGKAQGTGLRYGLVGSLDPASSHTGFGAGATAAGVVGWSLGGAAQGHGVYGRTSGDQTVYGVLGEHFGGGVAVRADSSTGVGLLATGQFAGISATATGTSASAIYALGPGATGAALRAQALNIGVSATAVNALGVGVLAQNTAVGGRALSVQGSALFAPGAGPASVTFSTHVDFSGATVTGLALGGVGAPLSLTLNSAAAAPLAVYQQGTHSGISVSSAGGSAVLAQSNGTNPTIYAINSGGLGAGSGLKGQANGTDYGVIGVSGGMGLPTAPAGGGVIGGSQNSAGYGVAAVNTAGGVALSATAAGGVGGVFQGLTGVVASGGAYGLWAVVPNGAQAILAQGSNNTSQGLASITNLGAGTALRVSAASGTAIEAEAFGGGFSAIRGTQNVPTGRGVLGQGGSVGVWGVPLSAAGYGVLAQQSGGAFALVVSGNARFDGPANSVTFTSHVHFGSTTSGLPSLSPPLNWTAAAALPNGVLTATNTGSGHGLAGYATQPGVDIGGPMPFDHLITAGLHGYSGVSMSGGVLGRAGSSSQQSAGVLGLALAGVGVMGKSYGLDGQGASFDAEFGTGVRAQGLTGVAAESSWLPIFARNNLGGGFLPAILAEASGTGVGVVGRNTGNNAKGALGGAVDSFNYVGGVGVQGVASDFMSAPGVQGRSAQGAGVEGRGQTGVAGYTTATAGVALLGDYSDQPDALGLQVKGPSQFDSLTFTPGLANAGSGRLYFDAASNRFRVSEGGGAYVNLVGGGVTAPLSLTSTTTSSTIYALNTNAGVGHALQAQSSGIGSAALWATGATYGVRASGNTGVFGTGSTIGVAGETNQSLGHAGSFINTAVAGDAVALRARSTDSSSGAAIHAQATGVGVSATATGASGVAVYGRANSGVAAIHGVNEGGGFSQGVLGEANNGLAGVVGSSNSGHGVAGLTGGNVAGRAGVRGDGGAGAARQYGVYGFVPGGAQSDSAGVVGNAGGAAEAAGLPGGAGVVALNRNADGIGVYAETSGGNGTAVVAVGESVGVSASAAINGTGLYASVKGAGFAVDAHAQDTLGGAGFPAGAALRLEGAIKTSVDSYSEMAVPPLLPNTWIINTSNRGPAGNVRNASGAAFAISGGVTYTQIIVNNNWVTPNSVIIVNLSGISPLPNGLGYAVSAMSGSFQLKFTLQGGGSFSIPNGAGFSYFIIN